MPYFAPNDDKALFLQTDDCFILGGLVYRIDYTEVLAELPTFMRILAHLVDDETSRIEIKIARSEVLKKHEPQ